MRIDKFLKVSRLIKRRSVAAEACEQGRVKINGKVAKPSASVSVGDKIEIAFGLRAVTIEVNTLSEHVNKDNATSLYTVCPEGEK